MRGRSNEKLNSEHNLINNINNNINNNNNFLLQNLGYNGDWGLGIGPNPQSPIPNPQSPIPNPQSPIQYISFCHINYR